MSSTVELPPRYKIKKILGRGGMGEVILAEDLTLNRLVAIKRLLNSASPEVQQRFLEEAQITSQLSHPGIIAVHDVGLIEGQLYLALRFVEGRDLSDLIKKRAAEEDFEAEFPASRMLRLFVKACEAVASAHSLGVLHRDLKPANIMVGGDDWDEVTVMDWGLAKVLESKSAARARSHEAILEELREMEASGASNKPVFSAMRSAETELESGLMTQDGAVLGTPAYMPIEQVDEPGRVDQRADIYAMGAVLYEILLGRPPFQGGAFAVLNALIAGPPPRPSAIDPEIPPDLEAIVQRAMAREASARYSELGEMARDIQAYLDDRAVSAYQETPGEALRRQLRRHRKVLLSAGVSILVLAAFLGLLSFWLFDRLARAEAAAARARDNERQVQLTRQRAIATRESLELSRRAVSQLAAVSGFIEQTSQLPELEPLLQKQSQIKTELAALMSAISEAQRRLESQGLAASETLRALQASLQLARSRLELCLLETLVTRDPARALAESSQFALDPSLSLLCEALARLGRNEAAAQKLERGLESKVAEPFESAFKALLSQLESPTQSLEDQLQAFETALRVLRESPKVPPFDASWLVWRRAMILLRLGRSDEASAELKALIHLQPFDPWAIQSLAFVLGGENVEEDFKNGFDAAAHFSPAFELANPPQYVQGFDNRLAYCAVALYQAGHRERSELLSSIAKRAAERKHWALTIASARDALPTNPRDAALAGALALALIADPAEERGRWQDYKASLNQCRNAHQKSSNANHDEGRCPSCQSLKTLEDFLTDNENRPRSPSREDELREGAELARRALELDPNEALAHQALGTVAARNGQFKVAVEHLKTGVIGRGRQDLLLFLSRCCLAAADPASLELGVKACRRAIEIDDIFLWIDLNFNRFTQCFRGEPQAHLILARIRRAQNKPGEALLDAGYALNRSEALLNQYRQRIDNRREKGEEIEDFVLGIFDRVSESRNLVAEILLDFGLYEEALVILENNLKENRKHLAETQALIARARDRR